MKKINSLTLSALLLFCINPFCNAISDSAQITLSITVPVSAAAALAAYWIHNNIQHTELEKTRRINESKEKEEEKRKQQFHIIEELKQLTQPFNLAKKINDDEFLNKMLMLEGSVLAFEKKINTLTQECKNLDPEIAQDQQELLKKLLLIRQAMHVNPRVNKKKNAEYEEKLATEKKEAEVRTAKLAANITSKHEQAAEHHRIASAKTESLVTIAKDSLTRFPLTLREQFNKALNEKSDEFVALITQLINENRNEHHQTRREQQQLAKETAQKLQQLEQYIADLAQQIENTKRLVSPTPSAPPKHTTNSQQNQSAQN